jgi:hypothetical protein
MKKLNFCLMLAVAALFVGCSTVNQVTETQSARLINTATYTGVSIVRPITGVLADLEVASEKILFLYIPSNTVLQGGEENVINSAVREALLSNGNADVLVALEKQIKYNQNGKIESITVTGYPAKYVNFRSPGDEYLLSIQPKKAEEKKKASNTPAAAGGAGGVFGLIKK